MAPERGLRRSGPLRRALCGRVCRPCPHSSSVSPICGIRWVLLAIVTLPQTVPEAGTEILTQPIYSLPRRFQRICLNTVFQIAVIMLAG